MSKNASAKYDAFISHAGEEKTEVARPLAERLRSMGLSIWLDETELSLGDDLQRMIDAGLAASKYGVVILSKSYFKKRWPQRELEALSARESGGSKVILPVWHDISYEEMLRYSPILAAKLGVSTSIGIPEVARQICAVIQTSSNPVSDDPLEAAPADGTAVRIEKITSRAVISLHGIRTRGLWQKKINNVLTGAGFVHYPLDYGYFGLFALLMPSKRKARIEWFRQQYESVTTKTGVKPHIVAHSFGAYVVAEAMRKYEEIRFDRIILSGSIVEMGFPWQSLHEHGQFNQLLNDYGGHDRWVEIAQFFVSDAGPSGSRGFATDAAAVVQIKNDFFGHSDYFFERRFESRWVPFLKGDTVHARKPLPGPAFNRRFQYTRMVLLIVLFVFVYIAVFAQNSIEPTPTPAFVDSNDNPIPKPIIIDEQLIRESSASELIVYLMNISPLQRADVIKKHYLGKAVKWNGEIVLIAEENNPAFKGFVVSVADLGLNKNTQITLLYIPVEFRQKLEALRESDRVRYTGSILSIESLAATVLVKSIELDSARACNRLQKISELGWVHGNKHEFCVSRGFDSVTNMPGSEYRDNGGGWCYSGDAAVCNKQLK